MLMGLPTHYYNLVSDLCTRLTINWLPNDIPQRKMSFTNPLSLVHCKASFPIETTRRNTICPALLREGGWAFLTKDWAYSWIHITWDNNCLTQLVKPPRLRQGVVWFHCFTWILCRICLKPAVLPFGNANQ